MSKPHSSLSPRTNVILIVCWGLIAVVLLVAVPGGARIQLGVAGGILGAAGGIMQHLSFAQATASFAGTASLMDVRRALKSTTWGIRYIKYLYACKALLIVLSVALCGPLSVETIFGYLAAYFSLMFVREAVTLRDTFALARLPASEISLQ